MNAKTILLGLMGLLTTGSLDVSAQETDPPPAPATTASTPAERARTWTLGFIDFSGFVDGYYNFNNNHPETKSYGNQLHYFDLDADTFALSMARITLSHDPAPIGFHLDLGFGKGYEAFLAADSTSFSHLEQAYVSVKPKSARGFEADFGSFVTSAGAELTEAKDNWNYSRSFLYAFGPFYHIGLRTSMPITESFTAGVQVVNGWNNYVDNNSGKTIGITTVLTKPKFSLAGNYYGGPENAKTNKGYRNYFDSVLTLTPSSKLGAYIEYDYWQNRNAAETAPGTYMTTTLDHIQGIATAARFQATPKIAFAGRYEYVADKSDAGGSLATASRQNLNEFTITGEYKFYEGILTRLEYRRDSSDIPYFNKGVNKASVNNQSTLEVGVIAFFGSKH